MSKTNWAKRNKAIALLWCDALALESIGYHETYLGNRKKRGLFESSTQKLINADLNGAINIMRKYISLNEIKGKKLFNPNILNIWSDVVKPAPKSTSQQTASTVGILKAY